MVETDVKIAFHFPGTADTPASPRLYLGKGL